MKGTALRNLRMFRQLCGEEFLKEKNVMLATTFWDLVGQDVGIARENELLETDSFFKDMKQQGCEVVRMSQSREENIEMLSHIKAQRPTVMKIQQELMDSKLLADTGAASAVSLELAELQKHNSEKLKDTKHRAQRVVTKSGLEMVYTRALNSRDFDATMSQLLEQQESVRNEKKATEA